MGCAGSQLSIATPSTTTFIWSWPDCTRRPRAVIGESTSQRKGLAAIKETFALEISRQRGDRSPEIAPKPDADGADGAHPPVHAAELTRLRAIPLPALVDLPPRRSVAPISSGHVSSLDVSVLRLRAAARRYQRQMQRAAELEARRLGWEHAA